MSKQVAKFDYGDLKISIESEGVQVPDTTTDAGPDTIELHEDAQKAAGDEGAEYDAAEEVDVPEDVEKANESTFFGIILKHRTEEAFAKTKGVFASADAFFKSNECKQAIAAYKQWLEKHAKLSSVSSGEFPDNFKKLGFSSKSINGVVLIYLAEKSKLYVDVLFKNAKGKVKSKKFAVVKIGDSKKDASTDSTPPNAKSDFSRVNEILLSFESDDPVNQAFDTSETSDTEPTITPVDAEPAVSDDISPDEIEAETGAESFLGAISNIVRSREDADTAVSEINDEEIDEVVGDGEGDDINSISETTPATEPDETTSDPEDEESKALEAFLADLDL
jgi:hypothetical protein